jgi:hypothetical protein
MAKILFFSVTDSKYHFLNEIPGKELIVNNEPYTDAYFRSPEFDKFNGFLGFYDWLLDGDGRIIGVYLALADHAERILEYLKIFTNVRVDDDKKGLIIFFSDKKDYREDLSISQCFGMNRLYISKEKKIGMSFSINSIDNKFIGEEMGAG